MCSVIDPPAIVSQRTITTLDIIRGLVLPATLLLHSTNTELLQSNTLSLVHSGTDLHRRDIPDYGLEHAGSILVGLGVIVAGVGYQPGFRGVHQNGVLVALASVGSS